MSTAYDFPRYLLAKQSVDDRALNKDVLAALQDRLPPEPFAITEVGGGIGTMLARLLRWDVLQQGSYTLVDEMAGNISFARTWLPEWAAGHGFSARETAPGQLRLQGEQRDIQVRLLQADMFDFVQQGPPKADLLIAHAVLDLLPMPGSLMNLFKLTNGLAWLTVNFDGVTSLEPLVDAGLDATIERLYHASMDARPTGGDSRSGRHLFAQLAKTRAQVLAAGASDWVVHPIQGRYPDDEAYFLQFILHFFEESLRGHPDLDETLFADWLRERHAQIERGELVYIAHQMDFLVKP